MSSRRPLVLAAVVLALSAVAASAPAQSRSSQLHDALKLTPAQEPAWSAFLLSAQPGPQAQAQAQATARLAPTLPTPRRLSLIRSQLQADLAGFDRYAQAVNGFYAQLSPAQQAAFDTETRAEGPQNAMPRR